MTYKHEPVAPLRGGEREYRIRLSDGRLVTERGRSAQQALTRATIDWNDTRCQVEQ